MGTFKAVLVAAAAALVSTPAAIPDFSITVPTDLDVGDLYRLAFVTSRTRDARSANIADYDVFVTAADAGSPKLAVRVDDLQRELLEEVPG